MDASGSRTSARGWMRASRGDESWMDARRPVVTQAGGIGAVATALQARWDLPYLQQAHPKTQVEVSVSMNGLVAGDVDANETIAMSFGEQLLGQVAVATNGAWRARPSALRYHLAQCPLTLLPALAADATMPDCVRGASNDEPLAHLWVCIGAGRSALHYDCFDGLLLVVRGTKRCTLLPPEMTRLLRPRAAHGLSANHSSLGPDELETLLATELGKAADSAVVQLTVGEGEALFIPAGWWHLIDSGGAEPSHEPSHEPPHGSGGSGGPGGPGGPHGGGDGSKDGGDVTVAVNWWWRSAAHTGLLGGLRDSARLNGDRLGQLSSAPARDDRGASFVLRCAFELATRAEQRRRLAWAAGLSEAELAHLVDPSAADQSAAPTRVVGRLDCRPCCPLGSEGEVCGEACGEACDEACGKHAAWVAALLGGGLSADWRERGGAGVADGSERFTATGPATAPTTAVEPPELLQALLALPVGKLARALEAAAEREPLRLAALLSERLGPAGAYALGGRLQEMRELGCLDCAARVLAAVDRALACLGGEPEQRAARERLLQLAQQFADSAAGGVLHDTLGLDADLKWGDADLKRGGSESSGTVSTADAMHERGRPATHQMPGVKRGKDAVLDGSVMDGSDGDEPGPGPRARY